MRSTHYVVLVAVVIIVAVGVVLRSRGNTLPYAAVDPASVTLSRIAEQVGPVSRIKISPDGSLMLAAILDGKILAFARDGETWRQQAEPLFTVATGFPGFPPEENGLSGMVFAADYEISHELFVTYAVHVGEQDFRNRVGRLKVVQNGTVFRGEDFTDIWEANVGTSSSHQIQEIISIMVEGKPHLLFLVGEGFQAKRALDVSQEAGKLMLIQRDGSNPIGSRPYPAHPKIQAIGIRNAPGMAINPADGHIAIVDTGPDRFDRLLYADFPSSKPLSFGWDGSEDSLAVSSHTLYRWDPTHTATNIVFDGNAVFVSLFGRTGQTGPDLPGRAIWRGKLSLGSAPSISWEPFVVRSKSGINEVGHPLALELDPVTHDFVFADIIEGAIYGIHRKGVIAP